MNTDSTGEQLADSGTKDICQSTEYLILLVEDNTINQIVITEELNHLGFNAHIAENGREGFEKWENGDYDLILTDCNMPVMNGYDMVSQIRQQEHTSNSDSRIPIVAISGNNGQSDDDRCFAAGMDDILTKPVELNTLKKCLDNWLNTRSKKPERDAHSPREPEQLRPTRNSVVDLSVLSQLVGDDPDIHKKLLTQFVHQATEDIRELSKAFSDKSTKDLIAASHRLKSSSRSIGAFGLSEYCASLELKASLIDWHVLGDLKAELIDTWEDVRDFLAKGPSDRLGQQDYSELMILVIDDDQYMLDLVQATFQSMGILKVICANSGEVALKHIDTPSTGIDIVFCDLNMPKMDGIELLRKFAERKFGGSIALISSEDIGILRAAERLARAHGLNVLGKIAKPLAPSALNELLSRYSPSINVKKIKKQGMLTEKMLRDSIENDQIEVYFQPQINIASQKVDAAETLARWQHPTLGAISPRVFVPLAESCGLINELTELVFRKSMHQAGQWVRSGVNIKVSVNLSIDNLIRVDLPEFLFAEAARCGVKPSQVVLEITESRLLKNLTISLDVLTRLRLKGFGLSIDDFGTGYSSMEQLLKIPFTELKIDRAFVHGAAKDPAARAILESSVNLAKKLELFIVAEGTENSEDLAFVRELGCNLAQGYYYSRPMPVDEFNEWLRLSA